MDTPEMRRTYSEQYFVGNETEADSRNVAVEWLRSHRLRLIVLYSFLISIIFGSLKGAGLSYGAASTLTNLGNAVLTFLGLHWAKGSPDVTVQGEYDALTVWEQIDGGRPWTTTKQIFIILPTVFFIFSLNLVQFDQGYMSLNLPLFLILVILPKVPFMHRVRIFGINSTVGIDDQVEVPATRKQD